LEYFFASECLIRETIAGMGNVTDAELIQASIKGDHNAFKGLVKRYEPRVAATVIGMLGKIPEADDVGQEVFIRFYNSLKDFQGKSSVGTYITRIAVNLSLNELKRQKRRNFFSLSKSSDEQFDIPDESSEKSFNSEQEIVYRALEKLDPKFRSVVVLRLLDGYSTKETAEILKLPLGTVLSRLTRAQQKLRELLSSYQGELV
jgi:RNA polymerase sigma-70 factor, ECF subfamily